MMGGMWFMTISEGLRQGGLRFRRKFWEPYLTPQYISHDTASSPETRSDNWPLYFYQGDLKDHGKNFDTSTAWLPDISDLMADDWIILE
jgi:hypothetical protein